MNVYQIRREDRPHGHVVIIVFSANGDKFEVGMDQHGGMHIHPLGAHHPSRHLPPIDRPLGYVYSDEAEKVIEALKMLQQEHKDNIARRKAEHLVWQRTCRERVHHGRPVDLSPAEVYEALAGIEVRCKVGLYGVLPEILYMGEWICFGRTDLMDDVSTSRFLRNKTEARNYVASLRLSNYGARVRDGHFFVVDAVSDG